MTQTFMLKTQQFCLGMRQQLGYPLFQPANDCIAFASGGVPDISKGMELANIATTMRKDIVYAGWASATKREPASVSLALRDVLHVDWIADCFLWAADDVTPLAIVPIKRDEHFILGHHRS